MTIHTMDCAALEERLADYLEGDLTPADERQVEAHLSSCARCNALVRELEQIGADAAELPVLTPSRDLWSGIARRIEAPVVPLTARPVPNVNRRRNFDRLRNAAIAAALVAVTAGVTYKLTVTRGLGGPASTTVAKARPMPDTNSAAPARDEAQTRSVAATEAPAPTTSSDTPQSPATSRVSAETVRNTPESVTYSREIDRLRTIFTRNRSQLDPRTAAIIEANLRVIDEAIAQSKAALAQDPASRFLNDQLNNALGKKVELLRTAALLPNRT